MRSDDYSSITFPRWDAAIGPLLQLTQACSSSPDHLTMRMHCIEGCICACEAGLRGENPRETSASVAILVVAIVITTLAAVLLGRSIELQ